MVVYHEYQPSEWLAPYIDCFWVHSRPDVNTVSDNLIVPDRTVELIITSNTLERQYEPGMAYQAMGTHLAGLKTRPQRVRVLHPHTFFGIRFKPHGLAWFTNQSVAHTVDAAVDPANVFGPAFRRLEHRVLEAQDDATKILLTERFLLSRLMECKRSADPVLAGALYHVAESGGNIPLRDIARQLRVSCKTIERRFVAFLGVNPKRYFRLHRFVDALRWYHDHPPQKLSDLAYEHGYFDQMHFIREVKEFTGSAPTKYFNSWGDPQTSIQAAMFVHEPGTTTIPQNSSAYTLRTLYA